MYGRVECKNATAFWNKTQGSTRPILQDSTLQLHGAEIKNIRFDKERKNILCTIEDFYNFNPNRTSVKGRIGYKLQKQGDLMPFYVIINVKIPKSVWDKYKIWKKPFL